MSRQRLTWGGGARRASAHPALPWEGPTHPAAKPDPEADQYENGDTSSWGEDIHPPPYRTSPAPAMPVDDGGYTHPATQPGAPAKNASIERHALKCVRVASAMLGRDVTAAAERNDKRAEQLLTNQAFDLMGLTAAQLDATLRRLEAANDPDEALLRKMLAEEAEGEESDAEAGEDEAEHEDEEADAEASKKASKKATRRAGEEEEDEGESKTASAQILAELRSLRSELNALKSGRKAGEDEAEAESDEEACGEDMAMDDEQMLAQMLSEADVDSAYLSADMGDEDGIGLDFALPDEAMGMVTDPMEFSDEDDALLNSIFAGRTAGEETHEEEEEAAEEPVAKKASRTASVNLRPQPRRPSTGVRSVGGLTRQASSADVNDLSALWESAPDVSKVFK